MKTKRIVAVILTLCLVLTLIPTMSFAAEEEGTEPETVWSEGFEDGADGWTFIDKDGDGFNWFVDNKLLTEGAHSTPHSGNGVLTSESYYFDKYINKALAPDNYAVSPSIDITEGGESYKLTYYVAPQDPINLVYIYEHYSVYVYDGEEPLTAENIETELNLENPLFEETLSSANYVERELDISGYAGAGKSIQVVFRHHMDAEDAQFRINIDDVSVTIPRYAITKADTTNGSFTVDKTSAKKNETVTITPRPEPGYKVKSVEINGSTEGVMKNEFNYTFAMPEEDVVVSVEFVALKPLTGAAATVSDIPDQIYTGSKIKPDAEVILTNDPDDKTDDKLLIEGEDYYLTYKNNINAGTATAGAPPTVIINGTGDYYGKIEKTFTINKKSIAGAAVSGISIKTYTGSAVSQSKLAVKLGDKILEKNTDYTVFYANNIKAGKATVKIVGKGNYTGTVKRTFIIKPGKAAVSKLAGGTKKVTVYIKSQNAQGVSGYQIGYKVKGGSYKYTATTGTIKTIKNLKSKKTYYAKVRAYKTIDGKRYYGDWSSTKYIRTK